uniref:T-cell surface glycoprotein CD3 zeta chain n=2 Tax=Poecilia TaxID=8080 RepID=A0A3B3VVK7_9TELE
MDSWMTGVFVLFALFMPVCCEETFFTDPVICYFLDAFLMVYCIAATALFFREKVSFSKGGPNFRELERPKDTDAYEVLDPKKAKVCKKLERTNSHLFTFFIFHDGVLSS